MSASTSAPTSASTHIAPQAAPEIWFWLFPLTYLVHVAEEYGGGFYLWIAHLTGGTMTAKQFLSLNLIFGIAMLGALALAFWSQAGAWLAGTFGAIVLINGSAHLLGSILTRTYSPGVLSGFFLWLPLGIFALRRAWQRVPRRKFWLSVLVGVLLHGLVFISALSQVRRETGALVPPAALSLVQGRRQ